MTSLLISPFRFSSGSSNLRLFVCLLVSSYFFFLFTRKLTNTIYFPLTVSNVASFSWLFLLLLFTPFTHISTSFCFLSLFVSFYNELRQLLSFNASLLLFLNPQSPFPSKEHTKVFSSSLLPLQTFLLCPSPYPYPHVASITVFLFFHSLLHFSLTLPSLHKQKHTFIFFPPSFAIFFYCSALLCHLHSFVVLSRSLSLLPLLYYYHEHPCHLFSFLFPS